MLRLKVAALLLATMVLLSGCGGNSVVKNIDTTLAQAQAERFLNVLADPDEPGALEALNDVFASTVIYTFTEPVEVVEEELTRQQAVEGIIAGFVVGLWEDFAYVVKSVTPSGSSVIVNADVSHTLTGSTQNEKWTLVLRETNGEWLIAEWHRVVE